MVLVVGAARSVSVLLATPQNQPDQTEAQQSQGARGGHKPDVIDVAIHASDSLKR